MLSKSLKNWDTKLSHVEFVYNKTPSYATSHSPFKACYGLNPLSCLDLICIPQEIKDSFEVKEGDKQEVA